MGKKKKNKHNIDYYDMTPEEQKANAERFNKYERGEISFLDALNYEVPTAPTMGGSNFKKQIEIACFGSCDVDEDTKYENDICDALNDRESDDSNNDDETCEYIPYSSLVQNKEITEETNDNIHTNVKTEENEDKPEVKRIVDNIPRISFAYNPVIGKMLIDDGYVTTPVSITHTSSIELNQDNIPMDSDAFGTLLSRIYFFIISCKHPAVIMSEDVFNTEFTIFSKLDYNKFIFFKNKGFVYAYVLDEGESDNFYSVIKIFNMDDDSILRYVIGAAFASNTMHNIFMYNDEDEVESVMDDRHSIKELIKLIEDDPGTEYAGHNSGGDVESRMRVTDLQTFISDVYSTLEDLIEYDDEDDDDDTYNIPNSDCDDSEDDDEDDDDDNIDVNNFPDIDDQTSDTDEINNLLDSIESSDEDEIINNDVINLPKIHRRS